MKNTIILLFAMVLIGCSREGDSILPVPKEEIKATYTIERLKMLEINPHILEGTTTWKIDGKVYSHEKILEFISNEVKTYTLTLEIEHNGNKTTQNATIEVKKETTPYSSFITKVLEYQPAVGQFINQLPEYKIGDAYAAMLEKARAILVGDTPDLLALGGFGGYVVFGFDHTVPNLSGADIKIYGNAFSGSHEPGIVMVAYDKNKNGKPDEDEWYEIAGSEYAKPSTLKNYAITYHKPDENNPDNEYIKWEDNQGHSGYKTKNTFHRQSYYPLWISENSLTFAGTKLENHYYQQPNGHWTATAPAFGYADVNPKGDEIDLSWAVDKNGNKVKLVGIDFVKVYTAINQEAGWLGEISTEISRAESLWARE